MICSRLLRMEFFYGDILCCFLYCGDYSFGFFVWFKGFSCDDAVSSSMWQFPEQLMNVPLTRREYSILGRGMKITPSASTLPKLLDVLWSISGHRTSLKEGYICMPFHIWMLCLGVEFLISWMMFWWVLSGNMSGKLGFKCWGL